MYIRKCRRKNDGKVRDYWQLVESYRTERGPRQRVVAYLGAVEESVRLGVMRAAKGDRVHQKRLFDEVEPEWVEVDTRGMRVERVRDFGGPWLGLQMLEMLGLGEFLHCVMPRGREEIEWRVMAEVLVLARLCDPCSELHVAEHLYERTALVDLLGVSCDKVNDDRLYRALDMLLPHKADLEKHLKERLGELFELEYDILLYDITSTYFEGQCAGNEQDLSIRPIWHQKKERVRAHILVCFLAYVLWKTLGQLCQKAGFGDEPRKVFEELSQVRMVDVVLPTRSGLSIRRRCVAEPTKHQLILLQHLGLALPKQLETCNL